MNRTAATCTDCRRAETAARTRRIARLVHETRRGWVIAQHSEKDHQWSASMTARAAKATGCSGVVAADLEAIASDPCVQVYTTRAGAVRALGDDHETHLCAAHNRAFNAAYAAQLEADRIADEARFDAEMERDAQDWRAREAAEREASENAFLDEMAREAAARREEEAREEAIERARFEAHAAAVRATLRVGGFLTVPTRFSVQTRPLTIVELHDDHAVCRTELGELRAYRYDGRRLAA